jgi:porin
MEIPVKLLLIAGASILTALFAAAADAAGTPAQTPWMHPDQDYADQGWGVLNPSLLLDRSGWTDPHALTGSWDGLRTRLYRKGISFVASYESETGGNPIGGEVHKVQYTHNVAIGMLADLGLLLHMPGTYFFVSGADRAGNSLSRDIPNFFTVQQLFGGQTIRLVHLALEKIFFDDRISVLAGRIDALDDFASSTLYCKAQNIGICANPYSLESNSSLSNYPFTSWGIRARYDLSSEFYGMTGAYNTYLDFATNQYHGTDFSIRHHSGVAIMQEFGYRPEFEKETGYPGIFKLGGFYDSEPRLNFESGNYRSGTWTIYATAQQKLYLPSPADPHRGPSAFFVFSYSPPAMNTIEYFASGGLVYKGPFASRRKDALGLFGLIGVFSSALDHSEESQGEPKQTQEAVLELNYRWFLSLWSYVQPDIQYIFRPEGTGTAGNAMVLQFQTGIVF